MTKLEEAAINKIYELFPRGTTDYRYIGKAITGYSVEETQRKLKEYKAFVESLKQKVLDK